MSHQKQIDLTHEEYIVALELWEQYHSPRCWKTKEAAVEVYNKLKSKSARLSAVKEQVLIRYLGIGQEDLHHPWSANGEDFNLKNLLNHLIQTVLLLAKKLDVPHYVPIHFPIQPDLLVLSTESELSCQFKYRNENVIVDFKTSARAKRKCLANDR